MNTRRSNTHGKTATRTIAGSAAVTAIFLLLACTPVQAQEAVPAPQPAPPVYLPVVSTGSDPLDDFELDQVRLWDVAENGGNHGVPGECGRPGVTQVHVFGPDGDVGPSSRLDGVRVRVVQYGPQGMTESYLTTNQDGAHPGMVEFGLAGPATVSIVDDGQGHTSSSDAAELSTDPATVGAAALQAALYCDGEPACAELIVSGVCAGRLSWNVVFKRSY